jgi:hypothetical protein
MQVTHGIISLCLILSAIATALGAVFPKSLLFGLLYILIVALCGATIVYFYCAKCPCRRLGCGHAIFGWLAMKFTNRKEGPYTFFDIISTMLSIAAILLIPQLWLIESIPALILFWVLVGLAAIEIVFFVCPDCTNAYCMFNKRNKFSDRV